MPNLEQLHKLLNARGNLAVQSVLSRPGQDLRHVTADSRRIRKGGLFVAQTGSTVDGHDFIAAALSAGAGAVLGAESAFQFEGRCREAGQSEVPYIQVRSSAQALAQAAALLAGFPARSLKMLGVTGTDGKTTTAALLAAMLRVAPGQSSESDTCDPESRVGLISTLGKDLGNGMSDTGYHVTTPDADEVQQALKSMLASGCKFAIVECTSHGLDQERVAETEMDAVGVTNVAHEHLDYHGGLDAYLQAKCRILELLADGPGRVALTNAEDPFSHSAFLSKARELNAKRLQALEIRNYGMCSTQSCTYQGTDLQFSSAGLAFEMKDPDLDSIPLRSSLWGRFNAQNVLLAAALARTQGATAHQLRAGLGAFKGLKGRMEKLDLGQPYTAIVDFAHSPQALQSALQTIRQHMQFSSVRGRLIAVLGSAGQRDPGKRAMMGEISARLADHLIITAEDPRQERLETICDEIAEGFNSAQTRSAYVVEHDRARAMDKAAALASSGDVVVAFGKGHERSMCFGETEFPWSDQQALSLAIRKRLGHVVDLNADVYKLPTH